MTGLKRGQVRLEPHQQDWAAQAEAIIKLLRQVLGEQARDIQHVGSTAIAGICAKPILDLAVAMDSPEEILPWLPALEQQGFVFRGQDVPGQLLLVRGDFQQDTRDCHVHVVQWHSDAWQNYLNFRDFLNAFPERAQEYQALKQRLARQFPHDRQSYTQGKQQLINSLLEQAQHWQSASADGHTPCVTRWM